MSQRPESPETPSEPPTPVPTDRGGSDSSETVSNGEGANRGMLRSVGRVLSYSVPHWRTIVLVILLMGVYSGANTMRLAMVGLVLDGLVQPGEAAAKKGKVTRLFETHVIPRLPADVSIPRSFSMSDEASELTIRSGTIVSEKSELADDGWRGTIRDGVLDYRTALGTEVRNAPFDELVLLLDAPRSEIPITVAEPTVFKLSRSEEGGSVFPLLATIGAFGMILALVIAASNYARLYLAFKVQVQTVAALRADIFGHLSGLGLDFFSGRRSGDLISRVTNDVGTIQNSLRYIFGDLLQHPLTIIFSLGMAFYGSPQLTLMVLPFFAILIVPIIKSGRKVKRHGRGSLKRLGEVTETMGQLLSGIRVVKAFGMEEAQQREFDERNAGFVRSNLKMVRAKVTARSALEGLYNLMAAGAILFGGWLITREVIALPISDFAIFLGGITGLYQPLKAMTRIYNTVNESAAGAERIFDLLDENSTVTDPPGAPPFLPLAHEVVFDGVWFRYGPDDPWVLRDVSFRAKRGETIALVGPSGSGKSTLLDLLARFHDPIEGAISLDGQDLRQGTRSSLLAQIAIVGQDAFLFHTTIGENIRHGRPAASQEEIEAAARAAAIADEIEASPEKYDTVIGERGMKVSGGQRQRITIARAILKNADILILDEATSALDTESERKVQRALDNLVEGRTTFVIAHRLSTIQHASRILVLDSGRIVESGTHDELVARDGAYARLLRMQEIASEGPEATEPTPVEGEDDAPRGPEIERTES